MRRIFFELCMQSSAVCQNAYKTDFEEVKNSFTQNVRQTQDALAKFAAKMERKLRNDDGTIECVYFFFNFLEFYQKYIQVNTNRLPDKCNYAIRKSIKNIFPNFCVMVSITFMDLSKKYTPSPYLFLHFCFFAYIFYEFSNWIYHFLHFFFFFAFLPFFAFLFFCMNIEIEHSKKKVGGWGVC